MRVLVTGASGFIGGVLCEKLLHRGHDVAALVRRPGSQPPGTRPIASDLSDGQALEQGVLSESPECVIHLAAEIASQRSERKLREVNVAGTQRLLEACLGLADGSTDRVLLDRGYGRRWRRNAHRGRAATRADSLRALQAGRGAADPGIRAPGRHHPSLACLWPGRLVRERAGAAPAPAWPLRGNRHGGEPVGRGARR